jgi:hypothetical protein
MPLPTIALRSRFHPAFSFDICLEPEKVGHVDSPIMQQEEERWPGLFGQESAKDKWIVCRLFSRDADMGRHAGRA